MVQRRRMHEVSTKKKVFECEACQNTFSQEANLWNHKKVCGGGEASEQSRKMCVCVWPRVRQVVHRKTQKEMCKGPGQRGRGGEKAKGIQGGNKGVRVRSTNGKNKLLEA